MLRHLQREGVNVAELMMRIEDVIVKTILCSEEQIASACKLFMPHRGSCFGEYTDINYIGDNMVCVYSIHIMLLIRLLSACSKTLRINGIPRHAGFVALSPDLPSFSVFHTEKWETLKSWEGLQGGEATGFKPLVHMYDINSLCMY